jgi:hypothetical protein
MRERAHIARIGGILNDGRRIRFIRTIHACLLRASAQVPKTQR